MYTGPKNFKKFHTFLAEKRRVKCKKKRISRQRGVTYCLKRPMLEKHGSPKYKITVIFDDSREYSPCMCCLDLVTFSFMIVYIGIEEEKAPDNSFYR